MVVIYFVGFKKCTTKPDNHFYSSGPREEHRSEEVSRRHPDGFVLFLQITLDDYFSNWNSLCCEEGCR